MRATRQAGFTLAELFVACIFIILILAMGLKLVNPKDYASTTRDAQRAVAAATIAQGIKAYAALYGSLPPGISNKPQEIGSFSGELDLCSALVPKFLKRIPIDPAFNNTVQCYKGEQYISGYTIQTTGNGNQVKVTADGTEGSRKVSVTD